jgi:hypothetical protein
MGRQEFRLGKAAEMLEVDLVVSGNILLDESASDTSQCDDVNAG